MNKIIVLSGNKRVGKDTVANFLQDFFFYGKCKLFSFARPIKEMTSALLGIPFIVLEQNKDKSVHEIGLTHLLKGKTPRTFFKEIGDMFCKQYGKEVFADLILRECKKSLYEYNIITDMRFKHEYNLLKDLKNKENNIIFIRVKNSRVPFDNTHYSETDLLYLSDDAFDFIIDNEGDLKELRSKVKEVYEKIIGV